MIPPTPVAAPSYGSTAEGWLWLSILKASAHPSPTSTAPAFSPGPCTTLSPVIRKAPQKRARVLVAAVLAPHYREKRELQKIRGPAYQLEDPVILEVREPERAVCLLNIQTPAPTSTERSILKPSSEPRAGSDTLSGCGMTPTTLWPSLQTPAMSLAEPFGFSR